MCFLCNVMIICVAGPRPRRRLFHDGMTVRVPNLDRGRPGGVLDRDGMAVDGVAVCHCVPGRGDDRTPRRPAGRPGHSIVMGECGCASWHAGWRHNVHSHAPVVFALPSHPIPASFAIQKRACLRSQSSLRRRHTAAACKQAWAATHRDLTLQHAAAALLRRQRAAGQAHRR